MRKRSRMSKRSSKKNFSKNSKSRKINKLPYGHRGGIRL